MKRFNFKNVKAKNSDKLGATSHQELLIIGEDYVSETVDEVLEIIHEIGITELQEHQVKMIMDIITADIIDRCINTQIETQTKFSPRYLV